MRKPSAIRATIKSLGRNTARVRDNFQAVLCEVAAHAYVEGDPRLFDDILEAASGLNRKAMTKWINTYGFARVTKDGVKLNKKMRSEADFADGDAVVEYLMNEIPAWHVTEQSIEQIVKELDALQRIKSLRSQITKAGTVVKHVDFQALKSEMEGLLEDIRQYA